MWLFKIILQSLVFIAPSITYMTFHLANSSQHPRPRENTVNVRLLIGIFSFYHPKVVFIGYLGAIVDKIIWNDSLIVLALSCIIHVLKAMHMPTHSHHKKMQIKPKNHLFSLINIKIYWIDFVNDLWTLYSLMTTLRGSTHTNSCKSIIKMQCHDLKYLGLFFW